MQIKKGRLLFIYALVTCPLALSSLASPMHMAAQVSVWTSPCGSLTTGVEPAIKGLLLFRLTC